MSLARIRQRLAAASAKENGTEKVQEDVAQKVVPRIRLSPALEDKVSYPGPVSEGLPLSSIGSLLFTLSGYPIVKTHDYFNYANLEEASQVLVVIVENMSILDLPEKSGKLESTWNIIKSNDGTAVVVTPAIAADCSTGSDMTQVEVNFRKDTSIIKQLISETSGVRKVKTATKSENAERRNGDIEEIVIDDDDESDVQIVEETKPADSLELAKSLGSYKIGFPRRITEKKWSKLRNTNGSAVEEESFLAKRQRLELKAVNAVAAVAKASADDEEYLTTKLRKLERDRDNIRHLVKNRKWDSSDSSKERLKKFEDRLAALKKTITGVKRKLHEREEAPQNEKEPPKEKELPKEKPSREEVVKSGMLGLLDNIDQSFVTSPGTVLPNDSVNLEEPELFSRTLLLLSPAEMMAEGVRLDLPPLREDYRPVSSKSRMFGVDCEMCLTTTMRHELTRVTVVDEDGIVMLDELVRPRSRIINYLTVFSGITAEMMQNVSQRRGDVIKKIREILPRDAILVGHSLESDLKAMGISHPYLIDTSFCFDVKGYRQKSKLKILMKTFLNEDIQTAGAAGHCSAEDSFSAMKLVLLKLRRGISFGDISYTGDHVWNGHDYGGALHEAMSIVAADRKKQQKPAFVNRDRRQGPKPQRRAIVRKVDTAVTAERKAQEERRAFLTKVVAERRQCERKNRTIEELLRKDEETAIEVIHKEYWRRGDVWRELNLDSFKKVRDAPDLVPDRFDRKREKADKLRSHSLVVLQAKKKLVEKKLAVVQQSGEKFEKLKGTLKKIEVALAEREKFEKGEAPNSEEENPMEIEEDAETKRKRTEEDEEARIRVGVPTLKDATLLLEEMDAPLEELREIEKSQRFLVQKDDETLMRDNKDKKVQQRFQDFERLALQIVGGQVSADSVLNDEEMLHRFVGYQLFVLRKNEEFERKRRKVFGTVALDRLYMNMFAAWKQAKKRVMVVAPEEGMAEEVYGDVPSCVAEEASISSVTKATRKSLKENDLVISHIRYDDIYENDKAVDSAISQMWDRLKPAGVIVVLLEGTNDYKQIGQGLALIAVKK